MHLPIEVGYFRGVGCRTPTVICGLNKWNQVKPIVFGQQQGLPLGNVLIFIIDLVLSRLCQAPNDKRFIRNKTSPNGNRKQFIFFFSGKSLFLIKKSTDSYSTLHWTTIEVFWYEVFTLKSVCFLFWQKIFDFIF